MRLGIVGVELGCGSRCTFYESIYVSIHVEFEHASYAEHLTDVESDLRNRREAFGHAPIAETVEFGCFASPGHLPKTTNLGCATSHNSGSTFDETRNRGRMFQCQCNYLITRHGKFLASGSLGNPGYSLCTLAVGERRNRWGLSLPKGGTAVCEFPSLRT